VPESPVEKYADRGAGLTPGRHPAIGETRHIQEIRYRIERQVSIAPG
jgi:hypothetical protein